MKLSIREKTIGIITSLNVSIPFLLAFQLFAFLYEESSVSANAWGQFFLLEAISLLILSLIGLIRFLMLITPLKNLKWFIVGGYILTAHLPLIILTGWNSTGYIQTSIVSIVTILFIKHIDEFNEKNHLITSSIWLSINVMVFMGSWWMGIV